MARQRSALNRRDAFQREFQMTDALLDDESGAIRIGPTDRGMVRFMISTRNGMLELDFPPEEAEEIANELLASAEIARGSTRNGKGRKG